MNDRVQHEPSEAQSEDVRLVADLLGGRRTLGHRLEDFLDVHDLLLKGLPAAALMHLVGHVAILRKPDLFEKATGMSLRTFQRHKEAPGKQLSQEQSARIWQFAGVMVKASALFGSQSDAERWLERPAIGLGQRCPIDLLATPAGLEIVQDFLLRLEYGVYT